MRHFAEQLVYSEVDFTYIHGGGEYVFQNKGCKGLHYLRHNIYLKLTIDYGGAHISIIYDSTFIV